MERVEVTKGDLVKVAFVDADDIQSGISPGKLGEVVEYDEAIGMLAVSFEDRRGLRYFWDFQLKFVSKG